MSVDPTNPVVTLCAEGMRAESEGRTGDARRLFLEAWEARTDDYDGCMAAHYVARHQDTSEATLEWNQRALACAEMVGDDRVRPFYPSLLVNLGHSYEVIGEREKARDCFEAARSRLDRGDVPPGPYLDLVADGVARAIIRVGG